MHVTWLAHLLHNCAMLVCTYFNNADDVVVTLYATTVKSVDCKNDFSEARLPPPPDHHLRTL